MPQRVVFNMPINIGTEDVVDRTVLADAVPRKGEIVVLEDHAYEVVKVLHVVASHGSVLRSREPICYLSSVRELSASERTYFSQRA
jgi:hypothetical protein